MMAGYLGSLGRLVAIECPAVLDSAPVHDQTLRTTLGGRRFARLAPRSHRSWSLRSSSLGEPTDLAPVALFANGSWGDGPFWWLSPWAVAVNVLTPAGSVLQHADLAGGTVGAPAQAVDGTWFSSTAVAGSAGINAVARSRGRGYTAVPTSSPYSAGLYVSAGQQVRVSEFDSSLGVVLRSVTSPAAVGSGLTRVTVSSTAGAGTTTLRVDVLGTGVCAGASLSLTPAAVPWGVGDGCEEAIVRDGGMSVTSLAYAPYAGQSYEVMEVGA